MKYGILIGRHSALSHLSAEWPAIIRKSSTMEAVSAVFKAKSSLPFFFFLLFIFLNSTHSDLLETYLPRFVPTAPQSEQPLSEAGMYRNIISHIRDTTKLPPASAVSFVLHIAFKVKAACIRDTEELSVSTPPFCFSR